MARVVLALLLLFIPAAAGAVTSGDEAEIRGRLHAWADAFNARDVERVCELFASDVTSTVRGAGDAGKAAICERLRHALTRTDSTLRYFPAIKEVLVFGNHAIVRLTWTLTTKSDGVFSVSREEGMDLFRRDADGIWRIMRFLSFSEER